MRNHARLVLALLLFALSGCSRVSVVYHFADFFIEDYADDYLDLDHSQIASWRPALDEALARHRRDELPYLAAFFDKLQRGAQKGLDEPTVECQIDAFEEVYRRHFRLAAWLAAPLLASLRPDQVRGLERRFAKDNRDDAPDSTYAGIERRARKRAERWSESAEWWLGTLSPRQREIVGEVTASMPDTAADWVAYRAARQAGLIRLLDAKAGQEKIRTYLTDWLVDYRDLPPSLKQARREIRRQVVELFVRLDASFSTVQRAHLRDRLTGLRDDFMILQEQPLMAELRCAGPG